MGRDVSSVLRVIRDGTLYEDSVYDYPENIKTKIPNILLMKHQLQSIYAMSLLENKQNSEQKNEYVVSEIGVLANKVGSGKSICILGLIAKQPFLCSKDIVKECHGDMFVMENRSDRNVKSSNLIVVPSHLLRTVWVPYLKQTTLSFVCVTKNNVYDARLSESTVVLCGAKYYNVLMKHCDWVWSRVIFDEADSIPIPACAKPRSNFVWFNTSSLHNLIFYQGYYWNYTDEGLKRITTRGVVNQGYIRNTFRNLKDCSFIESIVVKFNDTYLSDRLNLPPVVHHIHNCRRPYYLHVVNNIVSDCVLSHIHGNDMNGAMETLGCSSHNNNIISALLTQLHARLLKHRLKHNYLNQLQSSVSSHKELKEKIDKNINIVQHITEQIRTIHQRVEQILYDELRHVCPICMENTSQDTTCLFSCCLNLFCSTCVKKVIDFNIECCPLCRTPIKYDHIFKIFSNVNSGEENIIEKNDMLLKLLVNIHNESTDYHVVVFAMYEESILSVQSTLYKSMIQFKTLRGNNIQSILQWFHESKSGVLIVNAQLHGNGLNLFHITHMIMYQKFTPDTTMQLIGRAHRIGKTSDLHVHTLEYHLNT
jgi:hypothetical protein